MAVSTVLKIVLNRLHQLIKTCMNYRLKNTETLKKLPSNLEEALHHLENDYEYLLEGDVFTQDLIDTWIEYKYNKEILPMLERLTSL